MVNELKHDLKREAVPSIRGFVYQFWLSIDRWISLKNDEIIYLESAEDFDVINPENGAATLSQVKCTKDSITLKSKHVISAIENYWKLKTANPDKKIEYHLITTAQRGIEKDAVFGGIGGLDYWERCVNNQANIASLKKYLLDISTLSVDVKQYLNTSEDEGIKSDLLKRIKWITGNLELGSIQELVERKVCLYGRKRGFPYQISQTIVPKLLAHLISVICKPKDRSLEYLDFERVFDDSAFVTVPYRSLINNSEEFTAKTTLPIKTLNMAADSEHGIHLQKPFVYLPPILPDKCITRQKLVNDLLRILDHEKILIIKGTFGTGKSILARLLTNSDKSKWLWIDSKSISPEENKELFFKLAIENEDKAKYRHKRY